MQNTNFVQYVQILNPSQIFYELQKPYQLFPKKPNKPKKNLIKTLHLKKITEILFLIKFY